MTCLDFHGLYSVHRYSCIRALPLLEKYKGSTWQYPASYPTIEVSNAITHNK